MDQVLYLEDKFAEPFMHLKEGAKVRLIVDVVVAVTGGVPDFSHLKEEDFDAEGKTTASPKRKPYVHFVLKDVKSSEGRLIAQQSTGDIEEQIQRAKGDELEPLDPADMEKQIAEVKRQPYADEDVG